MADSNTRHAAMLSSAVLLGVLSFVSRFIGLWRDHLIAGRFGAGIETDAYYAAFRIPDTLFNLFVLGALSSAFIPLFTRFWEKKDPIAAWKFSSAVFHWVALVLIVIAAILWIIAPSLVQVIAPGFDVERREMTIELMRILLLSPILFGISSIAGGVLNAMHRFTAYAIAPVLYNIGIIVGLFFFVPQWGIHGLTWGVILGALLHMGIQVIDVIRSGYRYKPTLLWRDPAMVELVVLAIPSVLGILTTQLNLWVETTIGSLLPHGSVAVLNFANNLQSLPLGLFAISIAVAAFPLLSQAVVGEKMDRFKEHFSHGVRQILVAVIPLSVLILVLRAQIVRLVLGSGNFNWEDTVLTIQTLGFFTLSLFAQGLIPLLMRAYYAMYDTRTPFLINIGAVIVNIGASFLFSRFFGVAGLAMGFSTAALFNMLLLLAFLHWKVGDLDDEAIIRSAAKTIGSALVGGLVTYGALYLVDPFVQTETVVGLLVQAGLAGGAGLLSFVWITAKIQPAEFMAWVKAFRLERFLSSWVSEQ